MADVVMKLMLPEVLHRALCKRAEANGRPVEAEAVMVLGTFVPYGEDLTAENAGRQAALAALSDEELREVVGRATLTQEPARLAELNHRGAVHGLSDAERAEQQRLIKLCEEQMLLRGHALSLLRSRGHDITPHLAVA